jgi:hypothetical protein
MREWLQSMPYQRGVSWATAWQAIVNAKAATARAHKDLLIMESFPPVIFIGSPLGAPPATLAAMCMFGVFR